MSSRVRVALVVAFLVGFGAFGILAADAANPFGFTAVVNPLSQLTAGGELVGASCTSSTHCVAVGLDGGFQPLVLAGDPSTWNVAQAKQLTLGAGGELLSVTCTSSTRCVAVGGDAKGLPLAVAGNPATWSAAYAREIKLAATFDTSGNGSLLLSVSCTSATACVAVGVDGNFEPLVLAGDPSTWSAAQARELPLGSGFGSGGELLSVTCTSSSVCVAVGVGANFEPLVLAGDPSTWSAAQARELTLGSGFGSGGVLRSVTCTSSSACVAVGLDGNLEPLTLAGDPATWSAAQAQEITLGGAFNSAGLLFSIACATSTCVATGIDANNQPLVVSGDPSAWGAAQAKQIALTGAPFGVLAIPSTFACASASSCLQVGVAGALTGQGSFYLIHGSPAKWDQAGITFMRGIARADSVAGMACPSPTYCVAVGANTAGNGEPFILAGNPSTWGTAKGRVIALGSKFGSGGSLSAVACSSATSCVAVGEDANFQPLVLVGNPATWTGAKAKQITLPKNLLGVGGLDSVACTSATACVAVGTDGSYGQTLPLVLTGNPSTWSTTSVKQIALNAALGPRGSLSSVACTSSTYCVAVGASGAGGSESFPKRLFFAGNPATWTAKQAFTLKTPSATPTSVTGLTILGTPLGSAGMSSVSCDKAKYCVAVGGDNQGAPLYLAGNPTTWKSRALARPAKSSPSFLMADLELSSCARTACFASGASNGGVTVATFSGG